MIFFGFFFPVLFSGESPSYYVRAAYRNHTSISRKRRSAGTLHLVNAPAIANIFNELMHFAVNLTRTKAYVKLDRIQIRARHQELPNEINLNQKPS